MEKVKIGQTMEKKFGISPYTRGTTLNKLANRIAKRMRFGRESFADVMKDPDMRRFIATHNDGEFRRYPPNGKPGCFMELLMLAVGKKLGVAVK